MFADFFLSHCTEPIAILDTQIPLSEYIPINLSTVNTELSKYKMTTSEGCQAYINSVLERQGKRVAFGGYLEQRGIYGSFDRFNSTGERNIHLGMDFWCEAGTQVMVPITGRVHSFKNNADTGNYGPTIILEHQLDTFEFYTLYGHLSIASLQGLYKGRLFEKGEVLATLGTPDINVNYAPHLHFQIIKDLQGNEGDYSGVSSLNDLDFYKNNCPDPNLLLQLDI